MHAFMGAGMYDDDGGGRDCKHDEGVVRPR